MTQQIIFKQVAALFVMILSGFILRKVKIITSKDNKTLSEILLNLTLPLMIITSFQFELSPEKLRNASVVLILSFFAHAVTAGISHLVYAKMEVKKQQIYKVSTVFSNAAFMGFGILNALFGQIGIFYGSMYVLVFNIFLWTYGVMVFEGKKAGGLKHVLLNPGTIAVGIGLLTFLLPIQIPSFLNQAFGSIGAMTTPISMIVIGSFLAEGDYKKMFINGWAWMISMIRLIIVPLAAWAALRLLPTDTTIITVLITILAMPIATTTAIFSEKYGGNAQFSAQAVSLSTLLSMGTIPIILLIVTK